jgi:hypothetical protein
MATEKQISYIVSLVAKSEYASVVEAVNAYGLGLKTARDLTVGEASEIIAFLKSDVSQADRAEADARAAAFRAKYNLSNRVF